VQTGLHTAPRAAAVGGAASASCYVLARGDERRRAGRRAGGAEIGAALRRRWRRRRRKEGLRARLTVLTPLRAPRKIVPRLEVEGSAERPLRRREKE